MELLQQKFRDLFRWERRKRREQTFAAVACSALALAIGFLPLHRYLPNDWLRWCIPGVLLLALAPWFFYHARWRRSDGVHALVRLDKMLKLDERAVTAWELLARREPSKPAVVVLQQAEAKLRAIRPRALLPRHWSWPMFGVVPLLSLWLALLWLGVDRGGFNNGQELAARSLAQKLREYSRELQERAKNEGLSETLRLGQELEKSAQKGVDSKAADESIKKEVAGIARKFEAAAASGQDKNTFSSGESEENLKDLKAELEASKNLLQFSEPGKGSGDLDQRWMERLASLPQLKRQFDAAEHGGQGIRPSELKSFLDKLDRQVGQELDRRSVLDAQQYLEQLMKQRHGETGENYARGGGREDQDTTTAGAREKTFSNLPGKEPGKRDEGYRPLPDLQPGPSAQVKGLLGAGESSALMLKGKPTPGKSGLSEAEIVASYRRQAEQELNSERVPEGLKETIKNYFMALEDAKK